MSILIKGMEMPKTCEKCMMHVSMVIFSDGPIGHCMLLKGRADKRKCPLVPVPTPHGRLIDADALARDLDYDIDLDARALDDMDFIGKERERCQFDKDCKQNCMWYLTECPTIIEAEVEE